MRLLVLIFFIAVTSVSCGPSPKTETGRIAKGNAYVGGTLRVAEASRPAGLLPENMVGVAGQRIGNQLYCGLLRLDPWELNPIPAIAEHVESDTSGTVYVFHIRQGVQFHDEPCFGNSSRELTAHDAAFSLHRLCRPQSSIFESTLKGRIQGADLYNSGATSHISGVTVLDDYTLRLSLTRPDESLLYILSGPAAGIISKKAFEDCGQLVVGAGPFVPNGDAGNTLTLVRNRDYFAKDAFGNQFPYLDSVVISFISSKELAVERLLEGDLDLVTGVYLDPVKTLMDRHAAEFTGESARLVMERNDDAASFEIFSLYASGLIGFKENFLGHRDYSVMQMRPSTL